MTVDPRLLDHPMRRALNDEVHARPPVDIATPGSLSYIARVMRRDVEAGTELDPIKGLLEHFGHAPPDKDTKQLTANLEGQRLRWERHTEFTRYAFIRDDEEVPPFSIAPTTGIPEDWLARLRDEVMSATHVNVAPMPDEKPRLNEISDRYFAGNPLIGAQIAGGRAIAVTDFRVPDDGFMRLLILNERMSPAQTGRSVQRLLEIDTYRMMALLALPVAQALQPGLDSSEQKLVEIYESLLQTGEDDETELLNHLTSLATENQRQHASHDYRFAAANAYYDIVLKRIAELREERIPGLPTFDEFNTRRLTPAVNTCRAVYDRQQSLVLRMARATQLLSTRIDVERQRQNQQLLESMDRRARSQLRLQATVEGLSVAAVTYYVVGLVAILGKALEAKGLPVDPALVTAASIPVVAATVYYGVRRIRRRISEETG
jgi:uncharacterized membrane-anchored protein